MPSKDYLRFLQPNAELAAGFNFEKVLQSPELMASLFGNGDGEEARSQAMRALKEMDHLWLSFAPPGDLVVLMTGKFEHGAAAGMFYAQGIHPVFLGSARVMMIGAEPSIQAALARLAKPAANGGWVAQRARALSQDHETWIVNERQPGAGPRSAALRAIRRFAVGIRLTGEAGIDGEAIADSEASAIEIAAWLDRMKTGLRERTGAAVLDGMAVAREGAALKFAAKADAFLSGETGKAAMNSEFGVELYSVIMAGFPGMPVRAVAGDKLQIVKVGMKREEVLELLGQPLSVWAIQGLDTPRETWTYQVAFGKRQTVRLTDGVVTAEPR